jgi:hypothetical protein
MPSDLTLAEDNILSRGILLMGQETPGPPMDGPLSNRGTLQGIVVSIIV